MRYKPAFDLMAVTVTPARLTWGEGDKRSFGVMLALRESPWPWRCGIHSARRCCRWACESVLAWATLRCGEGRRTRREDIRHRRGQSPGHNAPQACLARPR